MDRHYRPFLAVALAAVASCSARRVEEPYRDAVLLLITPCVFQEDGETRVLLETHVVGTASGDLTAIVPGKRVAGDAWVAEPESFDGYCSRAGATVLQAPSMVAKLRDDAVLETLDDDGSGLELSLTPTVRDDGTLALAVHFEQRRRGRVVRRADRDELRVLQGKSIAVTTTDQGDR